MQFTVVVEGPGGQDQAIGTVDITEEVYEDDDALLGVLAEAGYIDSGDVLDVTDDEDGRVDIFEYETGHHRVSLVPLH